MDFFKGDRIYFIRRGLSLKLLCHVGCVGKETEKKTTCISLCSL